MAGAVQIKSLLTVLARIDERRISAPDLIAETGVSLATFKRLLQFARAEMGLNIRWVRKKGYGVHGWYELRDWGLFDPMRVRAWAKKNRSKRRDAR